MPVAPSYSVSVERLSRLYLERGPVFQRLFTAGFVFYIVIHGFRNLIPSSGLHLRDSIKHETSDSQKKPSARRLRVAITIVDDLETNRLIPFFIVALRALFALSSLP